MLLKKLTYSAAASILWKTEEEQSNYQSSCTIIIEQIPLEINTRVEDTFQRRVAINYSSGPLTINGFVTQADQFLDLSIVVLGMYLGRHKLRDDQKSIQIALFAMYGGFTFRVEKQGQKVEVWLSWDLELFVAKQYVEVAKLAEYVL